MPSTRLRLIDGAEVARWRSGLFRTAKKQRQKISTRICTCDRLSSTDGDQATRGSSVTESSDPPRTNEGSDPPWPF